MRKRTVFPVVGTRFGGVVVHGGVERIGRELVVLCKCDCGTVFRPMLHNVEGGKTRSCGCVTAAVARQRMTTHGGSRTPLHAVWLGMRQRCNDPKCRIYKWYGGRGIGICAEWDDFACFREWAEGSGYQAGLCIDRINGELGYSPGNCRWVTHKENMRNTRSNRRVTVSGETKCVVEWAEDSRCPVAAATIYRRLDLGWDPERAVLTPARH